MSLLETCKSVARIMDRIDKGQWINPSKPIACAEVVHGGKVIAHTPHGERHVLASERDADAWAELFGYDLMYVYVI